MAAIVAAALIVGASIYQGPPTPLPGVALGWPLMLYLERAAFTALVITGIGGVLHSLLIGGRVTESGGGPFPNVGVKDPTKPTEALKEGVDADIRELADRVLRVEKQLEGLKPSESPAEREE